MHGYEPFTKARHEDMLRAAANRHLAARARQARATVTAIPHPAVALAIAAETVWTPCGPRTQHRSCRLPVLAVLAGLTLALPFLAPAANAGTTPAPVAVPFSTIHAVSTTVGGAKVLPTTRTVAHWFGTALNPHNGVTYGFNMVGAAPSLERSTTITADIVPVNVVIGGQTFSGSDVVQPVLDSPVFTSNSYFSTPFATSADGGVTTGGVLSSGNTNNQLEDATMRSQFNKQGTGYHVLLHPVVHDPITIVVPSGKGTLIQTPGGVVADDVSISWWASRIQNLDNSLGYIDPARLPVYLTNNLMLFSGTDPLNCCVFGFHGAGASASGGGNQPVQTFAWASYVTPGFFNPFTAWAAQDIHGLSHEVSEWADDPFVNNTVEPWLTPTAPQYGCTSLMETGDPVVGIGFATGTNTFEQGPTPTGIQVADGYYHPEDEAFLPWFMRLSPSTSQEVQAGTGGRYTLMGGLNPFPALNMPATGC
jgi:hypothetical protein